MDYKLCKHEVEIIKSALNAHINQCEKFLIDGGLTLDEAEKVIIKVEKMKNLKEIFNSK